MYAGLVLAQKQPNFLVIISDDQRYDSLDEIMPATRKRIFDEGARFSTAYVTTPQCCPSRASILTGMYASRHGVRVNNLPLNIPTIADHLKKRGYSTALVGKYLNSWGGSPRPEYDYWVSFKKGSSRYINPLLNVQGVWGRHKGYITYLLGDHVKSFFQQAHAGATPFLMVFAPNAPHEPAIPAREDTRKFLDLKPHRPPNYLEVDQSDKPDWLRGRRPLDKEHQEKVDEFRIRQLQTLAALDRTVNSFLDELERLKMLDNTVVFFISDNGVMWGEHGLTSKSCVYEAAIKVPFAVRYPALVPQAQVYSELVANIDIAPTIYELAGVPEPAGVNGKSLVSVLQGRGGGHAHLLIQDWRGEKVVKIRRPFAAVHTGRFVYVENKGDRPEFYDLKQDPHQLENGYNNPANKEQIAKLKIKLRELREESTPLSVQ